jgi:hypothetical protein
VRASESEEAEPREDSSNWVANVSRSPKIQVLRDEVTADDERWLPPRAGDASREHQAGHEAAGGSGSSGSVAFTVRPIGR